MGMFLSAWLRNELFFRQLALIIFLGTLFLMGWHYIHMLWTPFILGWGTAYVFNVPVSWLEYKLHIPRAISAALCVGTLVLVATVSITFSVPFLQSKLMQFALAIPDYANSVAERVKPILDQSNLSSYIKPNWPEYVSHMGRELIQLILSFVSNSMVLANLFTLIILTPIVAFYSLKDWDSWANQLKQSIQSPFWRGYLKAIDEHLMAFICGQSAVCLSLMVLYSVGLAIVGIKGAVILGVIIGLFAFIPYGAVVTGLLSALLSAFSQMNEGAPLLAIVLIVGFLGAIEAYVLIPNFIGKRLGVHPVGVLFFFLLCVSTIGLSGVLLAMPLLAVVSATINFAKRYSASYSKTQSKLIENNKK